MIFWFDERCDFKTEDATKEEGAKESSKGKEREGSKGSGTLYYPTFFLLFYFFLKTIFEHVFTDRLKKYVHFQR